MRLSVVGVDLAAGRGTTSLATLTLASSGVAPGGLALRSLIHAPDDDAIIAEVARERPGVIALDAPLTLPTPVAAALAGKASPPGASPYTRAAERDPTWSRLGVRPFPVSFLGGLTFRAIPLAARLRETFPATQVIEVFPTGALVALGLRTPSARGRSRQPKTSLDERRHTQSALSRIIAGLPTSGEGDTPLDADSLDAVVAAIVAALFARGNVERIGEEREGVIVMPSADAAAHLSVTE